MVLPVKAMVAVADALHTVPVLVNVNVPALCVHEHPAATEAVVHVTLNALLTVAPAVTAIEVVTVMASINVIAAPPFVRRPFSATPSVCTVVVVALQKCRSAQDHTNVELQLKLVP